ncbi:MAG: hypothetical protein JKY34_05960 [Kordiimonadaceae bacterium]|nr:hypothetical protein [Kordiimonadaceae bacterium]
MIFYTALMAVMLLSAPQEDQTSVQPEGSMPKACETIETTITGKSMQGLLWNRQKITVYRPSCGEAQLYDYLLFTHKETPNAVVKQLWGRPGDILAVLPTGHFTVNGVKALTPFKKPYKLMGAYRTKFKKIQGPIEGYLVLGHPGSLDSARVGIIPEKDILGYVKRAEPYKAD